MTTRNKDLFYKDPTQTKIPNDGVAKVVRPQTELQWDVLEWELKSFVCEGEYERGLERILNSFLTNLGQAQQPPVWVSGFYGSGKSHLCRVLEYLWRDVKLPSGESARSLVNIPADIEAHLVELSTAGRRSGGLWSAAGTLGSGRSQAVRLAFLSVLFDSAGLPQQYPLARFVIWAKENGYLDSIESALAAAEKTLEKEIHHLYVSPVIANALLSADPSLADSVADVHDLLQVQFPPRSEDITDEEMFAAIEDVLQLQSNTEDTYPLTLIVLDEMQQYLGEDHARTLAVQNIVEGVSSRFDNSVLFVATGQSAMGATPTLEKLTDRFPVHVHLSDKDVEAVVRQVILRKKPDRVDELVEVLDEVSGEIDRHLGGTKIGPVAADKQDLVPDYPLLPTRRRFWELALRALDRAGKSGVLRTQLRIVHEAARHVADDPVGHVVGADFLYFQQAPSLQQSGQLLKEISESILALNDEGSDGEMKSRICALVFLITSIPNQMIGTGETGLRATASYIEDLLVEDLREGGPEVRKRVPGLLEELVAAGQLMQLGDEYRIQTEEGAEWEKEYRGRLSTVRDDPAKLATIRTERLTAAVETAMGGLRLTHGNSKTARELDLHFGVDRPSGDGVDVPVWIRDEWTVAESSVRSDAVQAGDDDAIVYVLLPKHDAAAFKDALTSYVAALETFQAKPMPQTDEGKQARQAMKGRIETAEERLSSLCEEVIAKAIVLQGGGNTVIAYSFRDAVELAAERSLIRLFPKFDVADNPNWGKVVTKARDGAPDALQAVGHSGEVVENPVCKMVLSAVSAAGTKGAEIQTRFSGSPYGWHNDAIRGALLTLLAMSHIRAAQDGVTLSGPGELEPRRIGKTTFYKEDEPPSQKQRLAVRGLLAAANVKYENGQEKVQIPALIQRLYDLAAGAGGDPPLPEVPSIDHLDELRALGGNQHFRAVADAHERLKADLQKWSLAANRREERLREWTMLRDFLQHAQGLDMAEAVAQQRTAILEGRQLLDDPDPVRPLIDAVAQPLREELNAATKHLHARLEEARTELGSTEEWQQLSEDDRSEIIRSVGLTSPDEPDVSSQDKLLLALNETPLSAWRDRVELVPARAKRARASAASKLEPTAVRLAPESATLRSELEVDAYLGTLRQMIIEQIEAGRTVVI